MTTYVYETLPAKEGDSVEYFEIKQSMKDAPSACTVRRTVDLDRRSGDNQLRLA
jgi:hypothetical protein